MQRPTGRIVGIIKRNWRPYCGMLSKSQIKEVRLLPKFLYYNSSLSRLDFLDALLIFIKHALVFFQSRRHLFTPADRRIPRIRIETRQASALEGQRIIVAIDGWPRNSRYPNVSLK